MALPAASFLAAWNELADGGRRLLHWFPVNGRASDVLPRDGRAQQAGDGVRSG